MKPTLIASLYFKHMIDIKLKVKTDRSLIVSCTQRILLRVVVKGRGCTTEQFAALIDARFGCNGNTLT